MRYIFPFIIIGAIAVTFCFFTKEEKVLRTNDVYVRGQYGKMCYTIENANPRIKYPLFFSTYDECMQSIK